MKNENDSIVMDWTEDNAKSTLCQAMYDETIRLRKCRSGKERDSIRRFLIESYQSLIVNVQYKNGQEKLQCGIRQ